MQIPEIKNNLLFALKSLVKFAAFLLIIMILCCCNNNNHKNYPPNLTKAIDLFYLENHNDEVISLINELDTNKLNRDTKLLSQIFKIAAICENGKPDSASILLQKLDQKFILNNSELDKSYKSVCGLILYRTNKFTESYSSLIQAVNYPSIDVRYKALNERILARICIALGDYSKGIDWLLLSSQDFELAGLTKSVAINHKIMGRYYMNMENLPQALLSFQKAESGILESNDSLELFYIYINYVDYYIKSNDLKKARHYAQLCMQQCENGNDNNMKTLVYNNMGEIEMQLKNYSAAIEFFNKTLNTPTDYPLANVRHTNSHINLSKIYKETYQNDSSLYHANAAVLHLEKKNVSTLRYRVYKNLAECYFNNQSLANAYKNLDTAYQNMDSINTLYGATSKAYYDSKVELVKASYNVQQLAEKELKQRIISISIAVVLILTLILGFFYYKILKSRNNVLKVLVEKNLKIFEDERKLNRSKLIVKPKKVSQKVSENEKSDLLFNQFIAWLETDNNFIRKDLTLEVVAKEINTNREYLSRAINENNFRFTDLINKFRVLEAIAILSDKKNPKSRYNLSVIANEVGFNSNSVFIEAFRKQTGMNPAQFRDNLQDII